MRLSGVCLSSFVVSDDELEELVDDGACLGVDPLDALKLLEKLALEDRDGIPGEEVVGRR